MRETIQTFDSSEGRYIVVYDTNYNPLTDWDFEDEADKKGLAQQLDQGLLAVYGVIKQKLCAHCGQYSDCDSLWGIVEKSPEYAYKSALECLA